MRLPWRRTAGLAALAVATGVPAALAGLSDPGVTAVSTFTAAADWAPPAASAAIGAKAVGYLTGSVKQGGSYYVYANVSDSGAPASGTATVQADLSNITTGASSVTLTAGSYSAGGVSYGYRSAAQTATNPLSAGSKSWTLTMTDADSNGATVAGTAVSVDNTAPAGSDVQTADGGGTAGRAQVGDTITFTFSEEIDPESVLSGWTGASTNVVVRLIDGGCLLNILITICDDDSFQIRNAANSAALPFGTVDLRDDDYYGNGLIGTAPPMSFGAAGVPSTMVLSGAVVTITLGTASATVDTATGDTDMVWSPVSTPYDAAGNGLSTSAVTEGDVDDREF